MSSHSGDIWQRAKAIVGDALDRPAGQRDAFARQQCGDDVELLAEVLSLLAAHAAGGDETTPGESPPAAEGFAALDEQPGTIIGRYELLQRIGEGGFGVVFRAEQREPVSRQVALKIIKLGMDTRQVVARFEQERQALALMDHPNIARVFDGGATESGRPYFVMEFVDGVPITEYCDTHRLSLRERLELFIPVCQAVQHAHQKGIIHRDLKPSNILVTERDSAAAPKVIDFGIAKATAARLTARTLHTDHGLPLGTLPYMSPEQAGEASEDIDTRSDVYSLGVLLYELLTGVTPHDSSIIRQAGFLEMLRTIREVEPPTPGGRLTTLPDSASAVAARRNANPRTLSAALRGDLTWIVMKALAKERAQRYETALDLSADIRRHLLGEPVLAAPPSAMYRARKFLRRRKGIVAGAATTVGALLIGLLGVSLTLWRALESERREREQYARAMRLADFHASVFSAPTEIKFSIEDMGLRIRSELLQRIEALPPLSSGPSTATGAAEVVLSREAIRSLNYTDVAREVFKQTVIEPVARAAAGEFGDDALARGGIERSLGTALYSMGLFEDAFRLYERSYESLRGVLPGEDIGIVEALHNMAAARLQQGQVQEANNILTQAARLAESLPPGHPLFLRMRHNRIAILAAQNDLAQAESLCRELLPVLESVYGVDDPNTLETINTLGYLCANRGQYREAESYFRTAAERQTRIQGADHPATLRVRNNLAYVLSAQDLNDAALREYRDVAQRRRRVLGSAHVETLTTLTSCAAVLAQTGAAPDAIELHREAMAGFRLALGPDHARTIIATSNLAVALAVAGRLAEAERVAKEALDRARSALGDDSVVTVRCMRVLGTCCVKLSRHAEAEALLRRAQELQCKLPDVTLSDRVHTGTLLVDALIGQARFAEAHRVGQSLYDDVAADRAAGAREYEEAVSAVVRTYRAWHNAEPRAGHDARVIEWQNRLDAWRSTTQPTASSATSNN